MRKSEKKPLSFSTTMRNPERIAKFLSCIKQLEGYVLTSDIIIKIVKMVIKEKLYKPTGIKNDASLNEIYNDESASFNEDQLQRIIESNPQDHKEKGFERGWESRFDTWYKLCKEFGFVYYEKGKQIEISSTGHMLCDVYTDNGDVNGKINKIFLNALMKYQTNNTFRKNANKNTPIPLLLNVLKLLKENGYDNGIHRKELPFVTCWNDNNHEKLYKYIVNFREEFGYNASNETIYEKCLILLNSENRKRFKMPQIVKEGVDDLIRKLRITGIFSLRGMGRFIDINGLELDKVNYIINNYTNSTPYIDEYKFYKYMGTLDPYILKETEEDDRELKKIDDIRSRALIDFSNKYTLEKICEEMTLLQKNTPSHDEYLKLIDSPTRLEFLTSLALVKKYPSYTIEANYAVDDEGNPTFTAKGGVADIKIYDTNRESLIEVTLMRSTKQSIVEIPAITRHLQEEIEKTDLDVFSIFIAPSIHQDTIYMCEFTKYQYNLDILSYTIVEFVKKINTTDNLLECVSYEIGQV